MSFLLKKDEKFEPLGSSSSTSHHHHHHHHHPNLSAATSASVGLHHRGASTAATTTTTTTSTVDRYLLSMADKRISHILNEHDDTPMLRLVLKTIEGGDTTTTTQTAANKVANHEDAAATTSPTSTNTDGIDAPSAAATSSRTSSGDSTIVSSISTASLCSDSSSSSSSSSTIPSPEADVAALDVNMEFLLQKPETKSCPVTLSTLFAHDPNVFRAYCPCEECLRYRETVIQLFLEDYEYNSLWVRLQVLIRRFYELPENGPHWASLQSLTVTRWVGDGRVMDAKKNIVSALSSNLPLSHDMTFILVFSSLYRRDPHQLFELLCWQLRTIATNYSEGFKMIIKTHPKKSGAGEVTTYDPELLLNYLLEGYDRICCAAKSMTPLMFELQRGHLHQFALTWNLLNKRIYQRWVYWKVKEIIPECFAQLKDLLDVDRYEAIVYRFIKFDDEMTLLTFKWREIWTLLNSYHLGEVDRARRERINAVHAILTSIKRTDFGVGAFQFDDNPPNTNVLLTAKDRSKVWSLTVQYLRGKWSDANDPRQLAGLANVQCVKCKYAPATHNVECVCRTCVLAGGPCFTKLTDVKQCTRCMQFEKIDRDYLDGLTEFINPPLEERLVYQPSLLEEGTWEIPPRDTSQEWYKEHSYHLAWAVFNHLSHRRPYTSAKPVRQHFCSFQKPPCVRIECRVAAQVIAGLYPWNFAKFLVTSYQPLTEEERKGLLHIYHIYITYLVRKLCNDSDATPLGDEVLLDVEDSDYLLLCDIGSAFAECCLTDAIVRVNDAIEACFHCSGFDIRFNMDWLEELYACKERENPGSGARRNGVTNIFNDPKLKKLKDISGHLDRLFFDRPAMQKALIKNEDIIRISELYGEGGSGCEMLRNSFFATFAVASAEIAFSAAEAAMGGVPGMCCAKEDCLAAGGKSGDHLAEAIKLAVNQKLNLQLEEELRTLKEEHSVLKDMVRDLEQMTENEEKQIKSKLAEKLPVNGAPSAQCFAGVAGSSGSSSAHGGNPSSFCCADHSEILENHPSMMCHRGNGQCGCYYCTIFGHTHIECNHSRVNTTRDRLRKRLDQQSSKDTASSGPSTSAASLNAKKTTAFKPLKTEQPKTETDKAKDISTGMAAMLADLGADIAAVKNMQVRLPSSLSSSTNVSPSSSPSTSPVACILDTVDETVPCTHVQNTPVVVHPTPTPAQSVVPNNKLDPTPCTAAAAANKRKLTTPIVQKNIFKNLDHLSPAERAQYYIDGILDEAEDPMHTPEVPCIYAAADASKKRPPPVSSAFAPAFTPKPPLAQHQPPPSIVSGKDIDKLVEFIEGGASKKDIQKKAAKKAKQKQKKQDDKKVEELEQLRNEFHEVFYKESAAKADLKLMKGTNKKDKKRLSDAENYVKKLGKTRGKFETTILELIAELKKNNSEFKFAYLPSKEQQLEQQKKEAAAPTVVEPPAAAATPQKKAAEPAPPLAEERFTAAGCEVITDYAKRMVTIRRVNMPHSDPQVTVTAKGPSPDKDKLLYTFINGQMVPDPAASASSAAELKAQSLADVYDMQHQQLRQINLNKALKNAATHMTNGGPASPVSATTTKEAKKKSKQKGDASPPIEPPEVPAAAVPLTKKERKALQKAQRAEGQAGKATPPAKMAVAEDASDETASEKAKKLPGKEAKKQAKGARKSSVEDIVELTRDMCLEPKKKEEAPKTKPKERRKVKAQKYEYADPQYKNNKFDVLDLDDDDIYVSEEDGKESLHSVSPTPPAKPAKTTTTASKAAAIPFHLDSRNPKENAFTTVRANKVDKSKAKEPVVQPPRKVAAKQPNPPAPAPTPTPVVVRAQSPYIRVQHPPQPIEIQLSKKQRKKLAQQQTKLAAKAAAVVQPKPNPTPVAYTPVVRSETMAQTLKNSMQRLSLNDDTTIELVREQQAAANAAAAVQNSNPSVSIIDQLSRGIQMEGLMLPPGITLTRVDPGHAEQIRAKKEAIMKICQPMSSVAPASIDHTMPSHLMSAPSQDPNGIIMVDTMKLHNSRNDHPLPDAVDTSKKNKKNRRRKNKNKATNETPAPAGPQTITLRNPMFHSNGHPPNPNSGYSAFAQPAASAPRAMPPPMSMDQPAAIIKNENGMFTIRNPALHQAIKQSMPAAQSSGITEFQAFPTHMQPPSVVQPPKPSPVLPPTQSSNPLLQSQSPENFSFFSDHNILTNPTPPNPIKQTPAIGSELKSAQQQRLQQLAWQNSTASPTTSITGNGVVSSSSPSVGGGGVATDLFNHLNNLNPQQTFAARSSPSPYSFNSDFIGTSTAPPPGLSSPAHSFYNGNGTADTIGGYNSTAVPSELDNLLFGNAANHSAALSNGALGRGGESPSGSNYYYGTGAVDYSKNYEDIKFLQSLQPGQRLNSEVTIHNVNDSKFNRIAESAAAAAANGTNGVEITRVPSSRPLLGGSSSQSSSPLHGISQQQQHLLQLKQQLLYQQQKQLQQHSLFGVHPTLPSAMAGGAEPSRAVGSNRTPMRSELPVDMMPAAANDYGDGGVFAPNQQVSLSELETEEREIESFKRFDYFFKPPVHKPKVNFDVKNIVLASRKGTQSPDASTGAAGLLEDDVRNGFLSSLNGGLHIDEMDALAGIGGSLLGDEHKGLFEDAEMKSALVD